MKKRTTSLHMAVDRLRRELRRNPDYRNGWLANLALDFADEFGRRFDGRKRKPTKREVMDCATEAANQFINRLSR